MSHQSLEDLLRTAGNPATMLRNSQIGAYVYPVVPAEYTNWRDEQRAWRETCVLFDQSFHMAELAVEGPGAIELLSHLGVNSFDGFTFSAGGHSFRVQILWGAGIKHGDHVHVGISAG